MRRRRGLPPQRQLRDRASPETLPDKLPLVHVTATGFAREIVESGKFEVRHCKVFNKELIYFFVLRPAYRRKDGGAKSDLINRFPFVFIVAPDTVTPYHVYPLDTGGADAGVFADQADEFVCLEDYELDSTHAAAAGQIGWAFGSLEAYFDGDLRADLVSDVPAHETVTLSYHAIAGMARSGSNQPDKRASAIEIATSRNVPLKGNVMLAIIPHRYLEDNGTKNSAFIKQLNDRHIEWETYVWQPNTTPNEFQEEIARIARAYFKEKGLMS
jgi:hypothetical protein